MTMNRIAFFAFILTVTLLGSLGGCATAKTAEPAAGGIDDATSDEATSGLVYASSAGETSGPGARTSSVSSAVTSGVSVTSAGGASAGSSDSAGGARGGSTSTGSGDGLTPVTLTDKLASPLGLVLDAGVLYWTNHGTPPAFTDGSIMKMPASGGAPVTLAANVANPLFLAVGGGNVFWTGGGSAGGGGGTVNKIATTGGSGATPSGLAQINNYTDNGQVDNTTLHVYGGDVLGNMWRFDFLPGPSATLLGTARDTLAAIEPITVRPELAELDGKPFVMFGTGRLLGASDVTDVQKQSVYGFKDSLSGVGPIYANPMRNSLRPMAISAAVAVAGAVRTSSCVVSAPASMHCANAPSG